MPSVRMFDGLAIKVEDTVRQNPGIITVGISTNGRDYTLRHEKNGVISTQRGRFKAAVSHSEVLAFLRHHAPPHYSLTDPNYADDRRWYFSLIPDKSRE